MCETSRPLPPYQPTALSQTHYDPYIGDIAPAPAPAPTPITVEAYETSSFFDYSDIQTFVSERPWETGCVITLSVACIVQVIVFPLYIYISEKMSFYCF